MSQLNIPTKKPRFGPKVATQAWWIDRIKQDPTYQQPRELFNSPAFSKEQVESYLLAAKQDFNQLGSTTNGKIQYPPKASYLPFYYKPVGNLPYSEFRIWTWLEAAQALEAPISQGAQNWYKYITTHQIKEEATNFLGIFRSENKKPFDILLEEEYLINPYPQVDQTLSGDWLLGRRFSCNFTFASLLTLS